MTIKLTKRHGSVTVKITAESESESADLADIIVASIAKGLTIGSTVGKFKDLGYESVLTKDAPSLKVFELKRGA